MDKTKVSRWRRNDTKKSADAPTSCPVPIGDLIATVFPESVAVVRRQSKGAPETPLPDLYETLNALSVKVGDLMNMIDLCHAALKMHAAEIDTLRSALQAIDKRLDKIEKKQPSKHERVKVLAGHLRVGDSYGEKIVTWLGKSWNEKFLASDPGVPPGVVFASTETERWASVQYAYLDANADPDND